ncbi:methyl-accepting chemotaxis protein [Halopseudomonas salegens]|uniref:Methyl-accepting chemotaxis protein n=1 Tax=Halopseudomonas salegens TaxID=1434072 RepID=A0A1H2HY46_9GAMM|nr:methyl-accepting chemotaxis protein [Halopseudomonas salegens]SDU36616.1 methyl-accepting chemotaxis protein [Halopseudomonas salegens]
MKKNFSIRFLLLATLASAFTLVLAFTLLYANYTQREHMEEYSSKYVHGLQKSFFDAINTMMVTGTIGQKEMLRERMMAPESVLDVRVVRSDVLNALYGPGADYQQQRSEQEMEALQGERLEFYSENDQGRVYTLIEPIVAMADYQGVNCLMCHQAQEGDILGAVRVDYSLAESDARLQGQLLTSGGVQILIFILAFVATALVLARLVISRLRLLHDRMESIADNSDLTIRLDDSRDDEIGYVARAFNRMVGQINVSMHAVMDNAGKVQLAAQQIASKAQTTVREVVAQKDNTDQVASATTELAASAVEVRENAINTSRKSQDTADAASSGERQAHTAVAGIEQLNGEVQEGARRIAELGQRTNSMNVMLTEIANIADQTNLLALNAAIEAARAGESGRGFSVVADEVRALASRTQDSTEEIRRTIESLKREVAECVDTMEQASSRAGQQVESILQVESELQTIATAIREITELNQQMENAADEQSKVSEAVSGNLEEISQSAEQTAQDARETERISADLLAMAEALRETINQFRLDQAGKSGQQKDK